MAYVDVSVVALDKVMNYGRFPSILDTIKSQIVAHLVLEQTIRFCRLFIKEKFVVYLP